MVPITVSAAPFLSSRPAGFLGPTLEHLPVDAPHARTSHRQGRVIMHHHVSCLNGPVTQDRPWWTRTRRKSYRAVSLAIPEIRTELVARVRRQIAAGIYDTPERWDAAL